MGMITSLLSSTGYIVINRALMKRVGIHESILLGELCSECEYWRSCGKLSEDGFFYSTIENIENATTLTGKAQRAAINALVKLGVLEMKIKGIPPVRSFRICEDVLGEIIADAAPKPADGNNKICQIGTFENADSAPSEASVASDERVTMPANAEIMPDIPQLCPNGTIKCAESEQLNVPNRHNQMFPNGTNVCAESAESNVPNRHTNNNNLNNNKNNNKGTRDTRESKRDVASARASAKPVRHIYGQYENVLLSDEDVEKLKTEFPDWQQRVERLSEYIASSGKKYKSHLATIRAWARRDGEQGNILPKATKAKQNQNPALNYEQHEYKAEDFGDDFFFDVEKQSFPCGKYGNVHLSDAEKEKLKAEFPDWQQRIDHLSAYIKSTGQKFMDHFVTIMEWAMRDKENEKKNPALNCTQREYTDEGFGEDFFFNPETDVI